MNVQKDEILLTPSKPIPIAIADLTVGKDSPSTPNEKASTNRQSTNSILQFSVANSSSVNSDASVNSNNTKSILLETMKKNPPTYEGKGSLEQFLQVFELYAEARGVDNNDISKGALLRACLRQEASMVGATGGVSFKSIDAALRSHFAKNMDLAKKEFKQLRQRSGETEEDFWKRVQRSATEIHIYDNKKISKKFVKGLSSQLKTNIQTMIDSAMLSHDEPQRIRTYASAKAKEFQQLQIVARTVSNIETTSGSSKNVRAEKGSDYEGDDDNDDDRNDDNNDDDGDDRKHSVNAIHQQRRPSMGNNGYRNNGNWKSNQRPTQQRQQFTDSKCYNCGETGHLQARCPSIRCQLCRQKGHAANVCWTRRNYDSNNGRSQQQQQQHAEDNRRQTRSPSRSNRDGNQNRSGKD